MSSNLLNPTARDRRFEVLWLLLILLIAVPLYSLSSRKVESLRPTLLSEEREPLYLPSGDHLRLLTLGFNNVASHLLWFSTINYFGKEFSQKGDFRWLGHMCDLVTTLDPRALHAYEFCGSLLSWVAKEPAPAQMLLVRGTQVYPQSWRLWYLLGFNSWYFLDDLPRAESALVRAAHCPNAPPFIGTLASRIMVNRDDPTAAVGFLKDLIDQTPNNSAKKALQKKLRLARVSRHLYLIGAAAKLFFEKNGRYPMSQQELATTGFLKETFRDPFKGEYRINPETGQVYATSGVKGLTFEAKTAKTGLLKGQFQDLP